MIIRRSAWKNGRLNRTAVRAGRAEVLLGNAPENPLSPIFPAAQGVSRDMKKMTRAMHIAAPFAALTLGIAGAAGLTCRLTQGVDV
ncbi:MAG: hypothetical protein LBB61_04815 [Treponema sp.]|nr:hypothetical protein [Treponema sp.]